MEEQVERWQLRSGTWYRDPATERWRLAAAPDRTVASRRLPAEDLGRMIGAMTDTTSGLWFPSEFNYSPRTGAPLQVSITYVDPPWIPPFGAPALSSIHELSAEGLRQTRASLILSQAHRRTEPARDADATLPPLAPGRYRFLVHTFDVASSMLMAIDPSCGNLLLHLRESKTWVPLEPRGGGVLAQGLKNPGGWRIEVVEHARSATLYLPTVRGLAVVTPALIGLSYAVEYVGQGPALGGPVAWAGEVWLPVLGPKGCVDLVGKPAGAGEPVVLPTSVPAPENGFEAPVFDPLRVIWPGNEGQLVLRLEPGGAKTVDWIPWPAGLMPVFSLGCPYLSPSGSFSQLCSSGLDEPFAYLQMGEPNAARVAVDAPRLSTGHVSYKGARRIDGDPWMPSAQPTRDPGGSEVVMPLVESELDGAVVGLRIDAPHGVLDLLESGESHRAVLQVQAEDGHTVELGALSVARPWLASLFVYDAHLWVHHPDLSQPAGWKLES